MAFLKGRTLEEYIAEGPMALDIARQVAEGLSAAYQLKRELEGLDLEEASTKQPLPEVRRGGKVFEICAP